MKVKKERKNPSVEELDDEVIALVHGGTGTGDAQSKYSQFIDAWETLEFPKHNWTVKQREGLCDCWEEENFSGTAEQWLSKYKTW